MMRIPLILCLLAATAASQIAGVGGLGGGGPVSTPSGQCLSPIDQARAAADLAAYDAGQLEAATPSSSPQPLQFYPLGAVFREDMAISNFVDLDTTAGSIQDFNCGIVTYDGHDASDSLIRTFDEQSVGVPIFAVADGVVVGVHDGEPDTNTVAQGQASNYVIVDHAGRIAYYWHVKLGSVAVTPGQQVLEGEEIARCGSSGNSNWPHLHFAYTLNNAPIEPFSGPCNPGLSSWVDQPSFPNPTRLYDAAVSRTIPSPGAPMPLPRDGELLLSDPVVYIWFHLSDLPANTTWRFLFDRPDGTLDFDSGVGNFNNPQWGAAWFWFNWNVLNMHVIPGTWTIRVEINGAQVAALPVDVVPVLSGVNHIPAPVTAVLEPQEPSGADALRCRVTSTNLLDDPDYDVVSHRFRWRVNGITVRDMTLGCRADMLPRSAFSVGDTVSCEVTPSDGAASAVPVTVSKVIGPGLPGSGDDLELRTGIDAQPGVRPHVVQLFAGDPLLVRMVSPGGLQVGRSPVLLGQVFATGSPPASPSGFPEFHLSPTNLIFVLFDGNVSTPLGPALLPPGGIDLLFNIPPGLAGNSLMLQALTVTNTASNGFFAASNAKELRFL